MAICKELIIMVTRIIRLIILLLISGCTMVRTTQLPVKSSHYGKMGITNIFMNNAAIIRDIEIVTRYSEIDILRLSQIFEFNLKSGFGRAHENFISNDSLYKKIIFEGLGYMPIGDSIKKTNSFTILLSNKSCIKLHNLKNILKFYKTLGPYSFNMDFLYKVNGHLVTATVHSKRSDWASGLFTNCIRKFSIYIKIKNSPWASYEPPSLYPEPPYKGGG